MDAYDTKTIFKENLLRVIAHQYGAKPSTRALNKDTGVSIGSIQRALEGETSIGLDVLTQFAQAFGLQPWHMLVPNLDPSNPPVTHLTQVERDLYEKIRSSILAR